MKDKIPDFLKNCCEIVEPRTGENLSPLHDVAGSSVERRHVIDNVAVPDDREHDESPPDTSRGSVSCSRRKYLWLKVEAP